MPIDADAVVEEEEGVTADEDAEGVGGDVVEDGAGHEGGGGGEGIGGGEVAAGGDAGGGLAAGGGIAAAAAAAAAAAEAPVDLGGAVGNAMWAAGMAIGDVRGARLAALRQRESELLAERRLLARETKNEDRKRRRLMEKARGLSFDDLHRIVDQMALAKAKAAAKPKPKPKAKGKAKAKAKAAADE